MCCFPDEGHGFARPENNLAFYAVAEAFLASNSAAATNRSARTLPAQPSNVLTARDGVPGLSEALKRQAAPATP